MCFVTRPDTWLICPMVPDGKTIGDWTQSDPSGTHRATIGHLSGTYRAPIDHYRPPIGQVSRHIGHPSGTHWAAIGHVKLTSKWVKLTSKWCLMVPDGKILLIGHIGHAWWSKFIMIGHIGHPSGIIGHHRASIGHISQVSGLVKTHAWPFSAHCSRHKTSYKFGFDWLKFGRPRYWLAAYEVMFFSDWPDHFGAIFSNNFKFQSF